MLGLRKIAAARLLGACREGKPVAPLLIQPIDPDPPELDIIGWSILGMQLQARALEPLRLKRLALDRLFLLRADRVPKNRQPAILLPELTNATRNTEAGRRKTARVRLCQR